MTSETTRASAHEDTLRRMWSRRSVIGAGISGAVAVGLAGRAKALPQSATHLGGGRRPATPSGVGDLFKLVTHTSQGFNQALYDEAIARGYSGYLEWQLAPAAIADTALDAQLATLPTLTMTAKQIYDTYIQPGMGGTPVSELKRATILRSALSKRQLHEHMVEFWTDHLNIDHGDGEEDSLKTVDDRDVIRAHALDTVPNLIRASAHSGAMLYYLDNYTNKNTGVNENYSRELMELHTLSPGNYTETDVREFAKVLTGWTIWRQADATYGTFRYRPEWHDNAVHTVLGHSFGPNGGQAEGEAMLDILTAHPACAQFISWKMCRWLLEYDPPAQLVSAVASTYLATGGDIKSMIRAILHPNNLAAAQPKLKRPFTFLTSLLRATNATITSTTTTLVNELVKVGQVPFAWGPPDGYPDSSDYWGSAVLPRWNFASRLLDGNLSGVTVDVTTLFNGVVQSQAARRCDQLLTGGHLAPEDITEVHNFVMSFGSLTTQVKREALALAASSPSYQYF